MTRAATPFVNAEITTVADAVDDKSPIEELQQTRAALRESEDRLHSVMQSAMDAIITLDEKHRIVKFNAAAEKMFDCPAHQALDGPLHQTFRRVLEHSPNVLVVVLSGQDDEALAMKAVHHGVQDYLIKGNISSKHPERAIRYAVEWQALLRSLEITRKQQIEFKNQFLSHVSHALRRPLTCIHQYVTLLLDGLAGPLAPDQSDHLKTVLKSVHQLHAMIRDLLEATRAESGKMPVERRCLALGDLIHQTVAMMRPS